MSGNAKIRLIVKENKYVFNTEIQDIYMEFKNSSTFIRSIKI